MRKLLVIICVCFASVLFGQKQSLLVEGVSPELYLTHIVSPKENFYSIGRMYNQHPKFIASFNSLSMDKGLAIGQTIKIPLNTQNLDLTGSGSGGETLVPVYHVVGKNETLFRIGNNHGVYVELLKKWNNLSSNELEVGVPLVVGQLKVKNEELANFNAVHVKPAAPAIAGKVTSAPVTTETAVAEERKQSTEQAVEKPIVAEAKQEVKPEAPKTFSDTETKASEPVTASPVQSETSTASKQTTRTASYNETKTTPAVATVNTTIADEGAFAGLYENAIADKALINKVGEAGTFKSTSGWLDKKYYVLMNDVEPGTILKVSANNKVIYAKVLGTLPEMKENNGLTLRMNNAAASYLGIIDPKFTVQLSYYKYEL